MKIGSGRRKDVFLVNVWREHSVGEPDRTNDWRGSVEHVHTRRRLYFTDLIDLVAFLAAYTNTGDGEPAA